MIVEGKNTSFLAPLFIVSSGWRTGKDRWICARIIYLLFNFWMFTRRLCAALLAGGSSVLGGEKKGRLKRKYTMFVCAAAAMEAAKWAINNAKITWKKMEKREHSSVNNEFSSRALFYFISELLHIYTHFVCCWELVHCIETASRELLAVLQCGSDCGRG